MNFGEPQERSFFLARALPNGHRIALHEQKPNVKEFSDDTLTKAYGSWALPEMVRQLKDGNRSLQTKVLTAFKDDVFTVHEGIFEGVNAQVVPVLVSLLPSVDDDSFRVLIFEVLQLLSQQTIGRGAISEKQENLVALKGHLADAESQVRLCLAKTLQNVCTTTEGADAAFEAGYLEALLSRLQANTGESSAQVLKQIMHALTAMMVKSMKASLAASQTANANDLLALAKMDSERDEEFLCTALDMILAVAMEDIAKDALINHGAVGIVCTMLHGQTPDPGAKVLPVTKKLSWKGKAKLWGTLASLLIRNTAKFAVVNDGWLRLLLCALQECDSVLVTRAAIQAVMHAADHPEARSTLGPLIPELQKIISQSELDDQFVMKIAKKCIAQLEWTP